MSPWSIVGIVIGAVLIIWAVFKKPEPITATNGQRDEARLESGATEGAFKTASPPELRYTDIDYKFVGNNPPLLIVKFGVMPTGDMHLGRAEIEISGERIPFTDWKTCDISPSVTVGCTNHCEIKGNLPTGEHDIRILIYANGAWWPSDWQTITYSPSVLDTELKVTTLSIKIGKKISNDSFLFLVTVKFQPSIPIQLGKLDLMYKNKPLEPMEGLPAKLIERVETHEVKYEVPGFRGDFLIETGLRKEKNVPENEWPQAYLHVLAGGLDFNTDKVPVPLPIWR